MIWHEHVPQNMNREFGSHKVEAFSNDGLTTIGGHERQVVFAHTRDEKTSTV